MNDLYIYYQVRIEDAAALSSRVQAMQARLALDHGVAGQLKRRTDAKDGMHTWMEVYPAAKPGFDILLATAAAHAALAQLIQGMRHTEICTDLSTCA